MNYPHKDTNMFKLLESLAINGDMTLEDLLTDKVFTMAGGNRRTIRDTAKRLLNKKLIYCVKNVYIIPDEVKSYVEDVMETQEKFKPENVVQPPYRNIWTKEMTGYTKSMYANKRNY